MAVSERDFNIMSVIALSHLIDKLRREHPGLGFTVQSYPSPLREMARQILISKYEARFDVKTKFFMENNIPYHMDDKGTKYAKLGVYKVWDKKKFYALDAGYGISLMDGETYRFIFVKRGEEMVLKRRQILSVS